MAPRDKPAPGAATRLVYSTEVEAADGGGTSSPPAREAKAPLARASGGKGIRLRLETRPGGRVVTLVLGLVGTEDELAATARALKAACGTGGTVKDAVVELQGDH